MKEKIKISLPVIVEGRYDKIKLDSIFEGTFIETGGFSIFNNKERQLLIKRLGGDGIIVLTDSDGGGKQIRAFLQGILPKDKIHNIYIPKIEGKERRKTHPSKAGLLGVEGVEKDILIKTFAPFTSDEKAEKDQKMITKVDFFRDKLTGCDNASKNRSKICEIVGLPDDMTPNALLEALNLLYSYDEYLELIGKLDEADET
jgi:ribonuclease M5